MASSEPTIRIVSATRLETGGVEALPTEFTPRRLLRRFLQVLALLTILVLVAVFAPGLGDVRDKLAGADPGWLAIAVALEAASCWSYVIMFRPVFCNRMSWRTSCEIAWAELGAGSIVPASGAGGLALGAWILHRGGMPGDRIARRTVAFFLLKSSVNFVAVAVIGALMAFGIVGPHVSPLLTALPAGLAALTLAGVLWVPRLGPGRPAEPWESKYRRGLAAARKALIGGTSEAIVILRSRDLVVLGGALGYWLFDNAVLWATYKAVGAHVPVSIVLMGYLIGQLGGLLPLPGGVGGIDGGLIGTLIVYGAPAAPTTAAVLAYRVILFWLPLIGGLIAFVGLRRALADNERPDLCQVVPAS
jgi:uncharacterized membrane protein YbhN (UPF0104 family)